ncbi:unnamed protein product [Dracunculus medinensis]|uniref:Uncharacterized protein n=1 Tax=Dracunculus medinensis TaxID=318479 RepID=A0A0N4U5A4_DRAME|nr:unnamed protein product [Dracunculus medinensis]
MGLNDSLRYAQDEVLQYNPLSQDEDYCIPSTSSCKNTEYIRCQLSFEDPQMDKSHRQTNEIMFEIYDYLTLKLEAMFNGQLERFPKLFTKEWDDHYSTFYPENDLRERRRAMELELDCDEIRSETSDDRSNGKKDKKIELDERIRKRVRRGDRAEKMKKVKYV